MRLNAVSFQTGGFNIQIYSNGNLGMGKFDMLGVPRRMGIDSGGSRSRPTVPSVLDGSCGCRPCRVLAPPPVIPPQLSENPYALGVLHALNVCDTVRTLLGVETKQESR